jgi:hypothetical protein
MHGPPPIRASSSSHRVSVISTASAVLEYSKGDQDRRRSRWVEARGSGGSAEKSGCDQMITPGGSLLGRSVIGIVFGQGSIVAHDGLTLRVCD